MSAAVWVEKVDPAGPTGGRLWTAPLAILGLAPLRMGLCNHDVQPPWTPAVRVPGTSLPLLSAYIVETDGAGLCLFLELHCLNL